MKHLSPILIAAAFLAAGTTACFDDPTSDLRNGPHRIELSRTVIFVPEGDSVAVTAEVKDEAGGSYSASNAEWTSATIAVATVRRDTLFIPADAFTRAFIKAVAPGESYVRITTHGLTDSLRVVVLPLAFGGTVTSTAALGDTIFITSTNPAITFSTAAGAETEVTIGGFPVILESRTASLIKVFAPPVANGTVRLTNVLLLGSVRLASLNATTTVTVTDDPNEPGNDSPATPTAMTLFTDKFVAVDAVDVDDFLRFTTPATLGPVTISIGWNGAADIDGYALNATGGGWGVLDGYAMASSANPETATVTLLPSTTYQILVEMWDTHDMPEPILVRVRTTQ